MDPVNDQEPSPPGHRDAKNPLQANPLWKSQMSGERSHGPHRGYRPDAEDEKEQTGANRILGGHRGHIHHVKQRARQERMDSAEPHDSEGTREPPVPGPSQPEAANYAGKGVIDRTAEFSGPREREAQSHRQQPESNSQWPGEIREQSNEMSNFAKQNSDVRIHQGPAQVIQKVLPVDEPRGLVLKFAGIKSREWTAHRGAVPAAREAEEKRGNETRTSQWP